MNTECIISSFIEYVSDFPNRQVELEAQAFPNKVWERDNSIIPKDKKSGRCRG
jgi:hypothetical protein